MCRVFGILVVISFCDFGFVKENFLFMKTTTGRGWFDIFVSFMFLVTSSNFSGWLMGGTLWACGAFFIAVGYCYEKDPGEGADYNSSALSREVGTKAFLASQ